MRTKQSKRLRVRALGSVVGLMAAGPAPAADAVYSAGPLPKPEAFTMVPPDERLTVSGVFADASLPMQLMFLILILAAVAALAVWAMSLGKVAKGDAKGLAAALARLRIVRSGSTPLGFLAASYVAFSSFLAISNVRPAPSLTVVAPGLAEGMLAIMLGLLATTVAVICERHLEGRIRRAAA